MVVRDEAQDPCVLLISASSREDLRSTSATWANALVALRANSISARDTALTSASVREHAAHRLAVVGSTTDEFGDRLRAFARGEPVDGVTTGMARVRPRIAMVFSGQGAQWFAMGRELLASEPVFRAAVEEVAALVDPIVEWRLLDELARDAATSRLDHPAISQPALFALQVGLCALWTSWGVRPDAVVGHSLGEITAAYVAGALTLADAVRVMIERGRVLVAVGGRGAMAVVALGEGDATRLLEAHHGVCISACNGPRSTTLSGDAAALDAVLAAATARGIEHKRLRVEHAYHSDAMASHARALTDALVGLAPRTPAIPFVSTVTGRREIRIAAAHWGEWVRRPVLFHQATELLLADGIDAFVEIGPHPVLLPAIEQIAEARGVDVVLAASLRRRHPERETMLEALGALHCAGRHVDWAAHYPGARTVELPLVTRERPQLRREPIVDQLRAIASRLSEHPIEGISTASTWPELGLDSMAMIRLKDAIDAAFGASLSTGALYGLPSIDALAAWLSTKQDKRPATSRTRDATHEPIAIVGMACRFPSAEAGPSTFWDLLRSGRDAAQDIMRWPLDTFYDPSRDAPGRSYTKRASLLARIDEFDPAFFQIPAREAAVMDPQQRLALEVVYEAFCDAAIPLRELAARTTGVFLGMGLAEYGTRFIDRADGLEYSANGNRMAIAAGRIAYVFDLKGPCFALDTACSSSLVAIHSACESLRLGTSDISVAGGVNIFATPSGFLRMSALTALSPDGRCKTWDASADGYGRGEGCGMVVLKRQSDALRDGDRIWAVIRGSAINSDGRSSGLTAPNPQAQERVIRAALAVADVSPGDVQYVEAHGTGTMLGDPIEVAALAEVFATRDIPLAVGSVKTNVGHLEASAGVAGLMKTVLAMKHRQLPASLHFQTPNPHIAWNDLPIRVQTELAAWPRPDAPLIAGVSAFGISGTNAHLVIEQAPLAHASDPDLRERDVAAEQEPLVLLVSAKTRAALAAYATKFADALAADPLADHRDIAYTASVRGTHHEHRLAVVGTSASEWAERLRGFVRGDAVELLTTDAAAPRRRLAMVFGGQGSQWFAMGRELLRDEPVVRATVERIAALVDPLVDFALLAELSRDEEASRLDETRIAQPALFALQIGLVELWRAWGVEPSAVAGHSVGEIAAAHVAGALSLEQAARLVVARGTIMQRATGLGRMAAATMTIDDAERLVGGHPGVEVAASNGPRAVTLCGAPAALDRALAELASRGVEHKRLRVDYAFHHAMLEPLAHELTTALADLTPRAPSIPLISTVTGEAAPLLDALYWGQQVRQRVRFLEATQALLRDGYDTFVEIGPHPVLLSAIDATADELGSTVTLVASQRRMKPARETMREALGALHCAGHDIDWSKQYAEPGRVTSLPSYPWQRERYWVDVQPAARDRIAPLLDHHTTLAHEPGAHVYELDLDLRRPELAYLADHRILGEVWFPATGVLELAMQGSRHAYGNRVRGLADVRFAKALAIDGPRAVQLVLRADGANARFTMYSRTGSEDAVEHASGTIQLAIANVGTAPILADALARCDRTLSATEYYERRAAAQVEYGPAFRGLVELRAGDGEAVGKLAMPSTVSDARGYLLHPALLDACLQVGRAARGDDDATSVPISVEALNVFSAGDRAAWSYVRRRAHDKAVADVYVLDAGGRVLAELLGLRLAEGGEQRDSLDSWLYAVEWREAERATIANARTTSAPEIWALISGEGPSRAIATALSSRFAAAGARITDDIAIASRIVYLRALDIPSMLDVASGLALAAAEDAAVAGPARLIRALSTSTRPPRLIWITRGAQAARGHVTAPAHALLWGFAASVTHERPELGSTLIDLDPAGESAEQLYRELTRADREDRIALRGDARLVARLVRHQRQQPHAVTTSLAVGEQGYALAQAQPGVLTSLHLRAVARPQPQAGDVEVAVRASSINFRDVLLALGLYPDVDAASVADHIGTECAGVVTRVGAGVTEVAVGDDVVVRGTGLHRASAVVPATHVFRKPADMSFSVAATIPVVFGTVLYALRDVGRLRRGERVLIHSAAGGIGLAAIQYAKSVGAEIIATAGSEAKRALVRSLGVEHVFDSHDIAWADEVKRATGGAGVDVILNSLAGEAIPRGLSLLRRFGRFVELGKRDVAADAKVGLSAFKHNISLSVIALDEMEQRESFQLFADACELFARGVFTALPTTEFPVSRIADAFAYLTCGEHVGKVVLTAEPIVDAQQPAMRMRDDRTYLITGGLGGIGRVIAARLVDEGARHLALLGRSSPSPAAQQDIDALRARGVTVQTIICDVADPVALRDALTTLHPELAGVVHAAGVLEDATIANLDDDRVHAALAPKLRGAFALHELTRELEMFVLCSSATGTFGAPGQAAYAAGNAFMDALASYRRGRELAAQSLAWGPWGEAGLATSDLVTANLARRGISAMTNAQGAEQFARLVHDPVAHVIVTPPRRFDAQQPLFCDWATSAPAARSVVDELRAATDVRPALQYLRRVVGELCRLAPDAVRLDVPLSDLGLDSLMMISLRNVLKRELSLTASTGALYGQASLTALAEWLWTMLAARTTTAPTVAAPVRLTGDDGSATRPIRLPPALRGVFKLDKLMASAFLSRHVRSVWVDGALDVPLLERALTAMRVRHALLRTRFFEDATEMLQVLDPADVERFPLLERADLSELSGAEQERADAEFHRASAFRSFDLGGGEVMTVALTTFSSTRHRLTLSLHNIVSDAETTTIYMQELCELWHAFAEQPDRDPVSVLPPLPLQYHNLADYMERVRESDVGAAHRAFWRARLDGMQPLQLPIDFPREELDARRDANAGIVTSRSGTVTRVIPHETLMAVERVAKSQRATVMSTLVAAMAARLSELTSQLDVALVTRMSHRYVPGLERALGFMINPVVLRISTDGARALPDLVARTHAVVTDAFDHGECDLLELAPHTAFRFCLVYTWGTPAGEASRQLPHGSIATDAPHPGASAGTQIGYDLVLWLTHYEDRVALNLAYNLELFHDATAAAFLDGYVSYVAAAAR